MINILRQLIRPQYESLNVVKIDANKLIDNYNYLKSLQPHSSIFPVLKSNAYGHGLREVCLILNKVNPDLVVVDSYPEAQIVYKYFKGRVLILGEMPVRAYDYCKLARTDFVVYNESTLRLLSRYGKRARIHIFVNSGMNREGIRNIEKFIVENKKYLDKISFVGLCSHLASADQLSVLNNDQENKFMTDLEAVKKAGFRPRWIHLGNSAGILILKNNLLTAYRSGLAFYGYNPVLSEDKSGIESLQPALDIYSHIVSLQEIERTEGVSYNQTYRATCKTNIGVIPFGYFEGLNRLLSNRAEFLVQTSLNGVFWAKIAGNVCMNLSCLDLGKNTAKINDIVQVISSTKGSRNTVSNLASICGTMPYEFLVKIQSSIRREVINN